MRAARDVCVWWGGVLSPASHALSLTPFVPSSLSLHCRMCCSLYQKERQKNEAALFQLALSNMMEWYAHPKLLTFKLTRLPEGYPDGFSFPPGMTPNTADYFGRGWCFCESSVSNLVKDFDFVLDLAKFTGDAKDIGDVVEECSAQRAPPLVPADFRAALAEKAFTSKKADEEMVGQLYEDTFTEQMAAADELIYASLGWGDAGVVALCRVISSGAMANCQKIHLNSNQIGDVGATAFAEACASGALALLKDLYLQGNRIGDAGIAALATAVGSGALPSLTKLYLNENQIGDDGMAAFATAVGNGALAHLAELDLSYNQVGVTALAGAGGALPSLTELYLNENQIGDDDMAAFATAMGNGALPSLKVLFLSLNQIGDVGVTALATAVGNGALHSLKRLHLEDNEIGDDGIIAFSAAIANGELPLLHDLRFRENQQIGNDGMAALATAVGSGALTSLGLLSINNPTADLVDTCTTRDIWLSE